MSKKPRQTKQQRERAEEAAACRELAAELMPIVGFPIHVQAVNGFAYRTGGAIALDSVVAIVKALKERSK